MSPVVGSTPVIELGVLIAALVVVVIAVRLLRVIEPLIINAVVGLAILWVATAVFELEVAITPLTLLVVALAGILGAIVVLALALLEIAFVPAHSLA